MADLQFQFSVIISPVFFVCGLFSSIISILILNKSEFKNQSTKTYLIITCIINIVYVTYLPFALIPAIWEINSIDCKIFLTFSLFIAEIQAWVLAFCSIDRLVFIVSPTRFLFRKNLKFQIGICAVASIVIIILIIPCVYFYSAYKGANNQISCSFDSSLIWVLNYLKNEYFLIEILIPFSIMITSSVVVYWTIYKRELTLTLNPQSKTAIKLAKSLVAMDIVFILTKLPPLFYVLILNVGSDEIIYSFAYTLICVICASYSYFYFLFLIIFNKIYRDIFVKYFSFFCKKPSAVVPIT